MKEKVMWLLLCQSPLIGEQAQHQGVRRQSSGEPVLSGMVLDTWVAPWTTLLLLHPSVIHESFIYGPAYEIM